MSWYEELPRPALTVDAVVLRERGDGGEVLLVRRGKPPFEGTWALPGGFVDPGEPLEAAVRRELAEETGVRWEGPLRQVGAYGDPGRDPRGWTVSVAFLALAGDTPLHPVAADDAADAAWHPVVRPPALAFDHAVILAHALAVAGS